MKLPQSSVRHSLSLILALCSPMSHAGLLGLTPDFPVVEFSDSGTISYNASSGVLDISGSPSSLFSAEPFILSEILGTTQDGVKGVNISFQVDSAGNFVSGIANGPDLIITGSVDVDGDSSVDYDGILLTAKVSQFGFLNGSANGADTFDLRLNNIGGALAYLYSNMNLAASITSEASHSYPNPFAGSFGGDWQGLAKGTIGLVSTSLPDSAAVPILPAFWLWAGALAAVFIGPARRRDHTLKG
ncbi:MAG: hypothetical protein PHH11_08970 [Methylomonas sp.]|nr:hypothetical protein [Methylomonas sp.]